MAYTNTKLEEAKASLALVSFFENEMDLRDFAFYSYPQQCFEENRPEGFEDARMWKRYLDINEYDQGPVELAHLYGKANVLAWEDNLNVYKTKQISIKFRESGKSLIGISRIGFNDDKTKGVACIKNNYGRIIFFLLKESDIWTVNKTSEAHGKPA
jgi:hypothetical protein